MIKLREYQEKPVDIGIKYFQSKNAKPAVIVAPTAFGKSIVVAAIADKIEGKTIVIQPTKELLEQNFNKFTALGGVGSIYSASFSKKEFGDVTFCTIGSIKSIGAEFKALGYKNVIVDECHLMPPSSSSMFSRFIKGLGVTSVLGLTATPFRLQNYGNGMEDESYSQINMITGRSKQGGFFKDIIYVCQISEIVNSGYWSKLEYKLENFDRKMLIFNTTGAEYTDKSIDYALKAQNTWARVIDFINQSDRKSILVFVPTIERAIELSKITKDSSVVYGDMPKAERELAIQEFRSGHTRVMYNVNVLSVGFDYPSIDCIVLVRPTASLAWYYQAAGRGTRICESKKDCLIVDFVGNTERFGRLEDLKIEKFGKKWVVMGGNRLLSGVPLNEVLTFTQEQIEIEKSPDPNAMAFPFGKHKGTLVENVNIGYLKWVLDTFTWNKWNESLRIEISRVIKLKEIQNV